MKRLRIIPLVLFVISITLTSCKKDVEDRLPGEWDLTWTEGYTTTNTSTTETTEEIETFTGTASFSEDGTGRFTVNVDDGQMTEVFTWIANESHVTLTQEDGSITFDIVENQSKLQLWQYTETSTFSDSQEEFLLQINLEQK